MAAAVFSPHSHTIANEIYIHKHFTSLKFARRILPEVTVAAKKAGLPSAEDLNHEKQPGGGF